MGRRANKGLGPFWIACELVFLDPTPGLLCEEALRRITRECGLPDRVWEGLCSMMYGELIDAIPRVCSPEHGLPGPDSANSGGQE